MRRIRPVLALLLVAAGPARPETAKPEAARSEPAKPESGKSSAAKPAASSGPERPLLAPNREVSVLYRLSAEGRPQAEIRISSRPATSASGSLRRIDLPDASYLLVNLSTHALVMVVTTEGTLLDMPWDPAMAEQFMLSPRMRFTRRGPATVSKLPCTVYDVQQGEQRGQVCVNDDGVTLRIESVSATGQHAAIEAMSMTYTPAPDSDYLPPPDFQHVQPDPAG